MKKVAIVVQRYGLEVNGGAEYHARILAEKLSKKYNIEILTTTALDYHGWKNHYKEGEETINGIKVLRFSTYQFSSKRKMRVARRAILEKKKYFKILKFLGIFNFLDKHFNLKKVTRKNILNWICGQGPYCPDLIKYIKKNKNEYHIFIFFTYLYYPTFAGMPLVKEKSIFIPTAHDEPPLYTKPYENLFSIPKFIMYNTSAEKKLVENTFSNQTNKNDIAGVGIEKYTGNLVELPNYLSSKKYFIYIGRIDEAKGCQKMLNYFINFLKNYPTYSEYKLVLVGKNYMKKEYHHPSIIYTGFISEEEKYSLLTNSLAMIMPSLYESLSLVTLEAMREGIPVIVNKNCEVLTDHISKSKTGSSYFSQESFNKTIICYIKKCSEALKEESNEAISYVEKNYDWNIILEKFDSAINYIEKKQSK